MWEALNQSPVASSFICVATMQCQERKKGFLEEESVCFDKIDKHI